MIRINMKCCHERIPTVVGDMHDGNIRKPIRHDLWLIMDRISRTDIGDKLNQIGVKRFQLAKQILLCIQEREQHHNAVVNAISADSLHRKTTENSKTQHRFYRTTKQPNSERISRMVEISVIRDSAMHRRGAKTREARYYHDFIRYCLNAIGCRTAEPFPIIFGITSLFALRPEPGVCGKCMNYKPGIGCHKPPPPGRSITLMLRCNKLPIGRREISNYCSRHLLKSHPEHLSFSR